MVLPLQDLKNFYLAFQNTFDFSRVLVTRQFSFPKMEILVSHTNFNLNKVKFCYQQIIFFSLDQNFSSDYTMSEKSLSLFFRKKLSFFNLVFFTAFVNFCTVPINSLELIEERSNTEDTGKSLSRQKRYLIFPEGSNVQVIQLLCDPFSNNVFQYFLKVFMK